eukprot:4096913-Pleurochrysis_carterae.AAC.1
MMMMVMMITKDGGRERASEMVREGRRERKRLWQRAGSLVVECDQYTQLGGRTPNCPSAFVPSRT